MNKIILKQFNFLNRICNKNFINKTNFSQLQNFSSKFIFDMTKKLFSQNEKTSNQNNEKTKNTNNEPKSSNEKTIPIKEIKDNLSENQNSNTMKTDPHKFNIYKKIEPFFGNPPEHQLPPPHFQKLPPLPEGEKYYAVDIPNVYQNAVDLNFPIEREPVSSSYSVFLNGKYYHVFNAARIVSLYISQ